MSACATATNKQIRIEEKSEAVSLAIPFAAVVPGLLLLLYFDARQNYHLSAEIVWSSVLLGAAVSILAIMIELPADVFIQDIPGIYEHATVRAFLGTALPEEFCKFLIVYWIALQHEDYERPADALVLSVAVALGFATFENLLYLMKSDDWTRTAVARAMTAVPSHVTNGMLMGYFLGLAHLMRKRRLFFAALALLVPTFIHGVYDLPLFLIDAHKQIGFGLDDPQTAPFVFGFAGIIAGSSIMALCGWFDLLRRDAREQTDSGRSYIIRRLPEDFRKVEAHLWLLVGGGLVVVSVTFSVMGFYAPLQTAPSWKAFYPQYFILASAILPTVFGLAMFGHGFGLMRHREA